MIKIILIINKINSFHLNKFWTEIFKKKVKKIIMYINRMTEFFLLVSNNLYEDIKRMI
jgi:hypothetical protein